MTEPSSEIAPPPVVDRSPLYQPPTRGPWIKLHAGEDRVWISSETGMEWGHKEYYVGEVTAYNGPLVCAAPLMRDALRLALHDLATRGMLPQDTHQRMATALAAAEGVATPIWQPWFHLARYVKGNQERLVVLEAGMDQKRWEEDGWRFHSSVLVEQISGVQFTMTGVPLYPPTPESFAGTKPTKGKKGRENSDE